MPKRLNGKWKFIIPTIVAVVSTTFVVAWRGINVRVQGNEIAIETGRAEREAGKAERESVRQTTIRMDIIMSSRFTRIDTRQAVMEADIKEILMRLPLPPTQ